MEQNNAERRAEYLQQNKKRQRRKKIVSILACVVVFCTTYALILPAITMTKMAKVLTCPLSVHEHVDSCYNEDGDLICGQADFIVHTHGEDCFNKGGDLICELPEIKVHKHTDACYEEVKTLTCPLEENEEHSHTDECYTTEQVLVCDKTEVVLHRHTEDCYDENGELICGQLEVLEHTHEDGCFTEVKKSEESALINHAPRLLANGDAPADQNEGQNNVSQYDLASYINSVTLEHRKIGKTHWDPVSDGIIKVGEEVRFSLNYHLPEGVLDLNNKALTYVVPGNISLTHEESGEVYNTYNVAVGTYIVTEDGHIAITFNDEYAQKNSQGSSVDGYISFSASVENINDGTSGELVIPFSDTVSVPIHVYNTVGDLDVHKNSLHSDFYNGTVDYEIVITSNNGTTSPVVLEDIMSCMQLAEGSTILVKKNGEYFATIQEKDLAMYVLPQMSSQDQYCITYSAKCSKNFDDKTIVGENTVKVTSTDSSNAPIEARDSTSDTFTRKVIQKSGVLDGNNVNWKITINASSPKVNVAGWTLRDSLGEIQVTISPNPETGEGSLAATLPYTFPENKVCDAQYIVTYTAPGTAESTNTATLSVDGVPGKEMRDEAGVDKGKVGLEKEGVELSSAGTLANGDRLMNCKWTVILDTTSVAAEPKAKDTELGVEGSYWILQDFTTDSTLYFTAEQLTATAQNIVAAINDCEYQGGYYIFAASERGLRASEDAAGVVLLARGGCSDDRWDAEYAKSPIEGIVYRSIYVVFDAPLQDKILQFEVNTTQNIGTGASEMHITNRAIVSDKNNNGLQDDGSLTYRPIVAKYDSRTINPNNGKPTIEGNISNHDENELTSEEYEGYKVLSWVINVDIPNDIDYNKDVVITESLPEGIRLLPQTTPMSGQPADNTGVERLIFYVEKGGGYELNQRPKAGFDFTPVNSTYKADGGGGSVIVTTSSAGFCTLSDDNGYVWARKQGERTYEIHISSDLANYIVRTGYQTKLQVYAYIEDDFEWDATRHDFTNSVTVTYDNSEIGSATQTQRIARKVITKASGEYLASVNQMPYSITVNPSGMDLVKGSDVLELTDVLTYTMPAGYVVHAALDYNSVVVTNDNTGENITSQCSYTVEDSEEGNIVTHIIHMRIPDGVPLRVDYKYQMSGNGVVEDLQNTASISGTGGTIEESSTHAEVDVQKSGAGAIVNGITVYKVDSENYAVHMNGATFRLDKWDGAKWVTVNDGNEYVTSTINGVDGIFVMENLDPFTAYTLTETKAPPGYEMRDPVERRFYIDDGTNGQLSAPSDFEGQLMKVGDTITIKNDAAPYELPETGGMGTAMYYAAGGMLMLAAVLLVCRKRRNAA